MKLIKLILTIGVLIMSKTVAGDFNILVMGQSNAVGSSNTPTGYLGTSRGLPNDVKVFDYEISEFKKPVWGENPLHPKGSTNLGIEAGKIIRDYVNGNVNVIVSGIGGISIDRWVNNADDNMIDGEERSVKKLLEASGITRVDAIIWSQGEADERMSVEEYTSKHLDMLNKLYALDAISQDTPFVAIGLGTWEEHGQNKQNKYLLNLNTNSDDRTSNVLIFETVKNPFHGNDRHFNHGSMRLLGARLAHEILIRKGMK